MTKHSKVRPLDLGVDLAGFIPNPHPYTFMWEVEVGNGSMYLLITGCAQIL